LVCRPILAAAANRSRPSSLRRSQRRSPRPRPQRRRHHPRNSPKRSKSADLGPLPLPIIGRKPPYFSALCGLEPPGLSVAPDVERPSPIRRSHSRSPGSMQRSPSSRSPRAVCRARFIDGSRRNRPSANRHVITGAEDRERPCPTVDRNCWKGRSRRR